jgi:hypothetical protein
MRTRKILADFPLVRFLFTNLVLANATKHAQTRYLQFRKPLKREQFRIEKQLIFVKQNTESSLEF